MGSSSDDLVWQPPHYPTQDCLLPTFLLVISSHLQQLSRAGSLAMRDGDRQLDLDDFLPYQLNVLASRVSSDLAGVYEARFGISIPEWRVIAHLARNREVSVREIRRRVDMDKSKVSRAAARLEEAGLIEKRVNTEDRRLVKLSLSRKGRRLYEQIAPLALDYEDRFLALMTPDDAASFRMLVLRLLAQTAPTADLEAG